jgi:hypothetical protein
MGSRVGTTAFAVGPPEDGRALDDIARGRPVERAA